MRFTRLTLGFITLIIGLGFYLLARGFLKDVEPQTYQATEEMMVDTAHLLAELADQHGYLTQPAAQQQLTAAFDQARRREFQAQIYNHLKTRIGLHVYLTDATGRVQFDSDQGRRVGLDYRRQRDVALTLAGTYGARSSRNDHEDPHSSMLYVAAPIGDPKQPSGVLTVYKPQLDMLPLVRERQQLISTACGLIGVGILAWIAAVFLWLFRPIGRITEYAQAVGRGERPPKPNLGMGREVNTLATALDSMRNALEDRNYVERYVQTLSHELKSPLAAIRGSAELLGEDLPAATRQTFLANLLAETARCERLISRLLELSAIENRKSLNTKDDCDVRDLLAQVIAEASVHARMREVTLNARLPAQSVIVRGDAFILRAAASNLLENAIDFAPTGTAVDIVLSDALGAVTLTIRDFGPGIPDFAQDRVFERFFSLRQLNHQRKGTGLGLTLVREAMDLHGGSINLVPASPGITAVMRLPR